jgi:CheY-like chemotaxis protein
MKFVPLKPSRLQHAVARLEKRPRVLYVEDEDINWEIAENELQHRYEIIRARTAHEAFVQLMQTSFHLILMDIQLSRSELDGLDVARILKGKHTGPIPSYAKDVRLLDTPIIFVTAYTARYRKDDIAEAGGADLITKPVNFTALSLSIARIWARGSGS